MLPLTHHPWAQEFEDYDTNQDGAIDFQEFVATRRGKEDKLTNVDDDWEEAELEDVGQSVTMYFMRHAEGLIHLSHTCCDPMLYPWLHSVMLRLTCTYVKPMMFL